MKTTIKILIGIVLLATGALTLLQGCNFTNELKVAASVMIDQTDSSLLAQPYAGAIKQILPVDKDNWQGYQFQLQAISDVDNNPIYKNELAPACEYISNSYDRMDEVNKFLSGIDMTLQKTKPAGITKMRSSIYTPLAKELNRLSESTAKRKILIVYSDLMENSYLSDFYKKSTFNRLQNYPDEIQQEFEKAVPLKDLKGIEVQFIYQALNNEDSRIFNIVSGFYKRQLENKGVKVSISASIIL